MLSILRLWKNGLKTRKIWSLSFCPLTAPTILPGSRKDSPCSVARLPPAEKPATGFFVVRVPYCCYLTPKKAA